VVTDGLGERENGRLKTMKLWKKRHASRRTLTPRKGDEGPLLRERI